MTRSTRLADVIGAAAGVVFAVLIFLSVASVDPVRGVSDQELQTWWADSGNRNGFVVSMYTLLIAGPLLLVFVSRLRARLRAVDSGWADVVFACGIVATAAYGLCAVTRGVIASSMRFHDEPLPGVDTLRFQTDLAFASWDLVFLIMAVMIAIASILAIVTGVLPRWLAWLGVPVALGCLVFFAIQSAPFASPLVIVWVLATSVYLWRSSAAAPIAVPVPRAEASSTQA